MQPIAAEDLAELCVQAGAGTSDVVLDAAGPETLAFEELVRLVRDAVGSRSALVHAGPRATRALTRSLELCLRRTLLTPDELGALGDDLLTSSDPPLGTRRLGDWVAASAPALGAGLASGERRPWR